MEGDIRVMEDLKNQIERGRINFAVRGRITKSSKEPITESHVRARLEGLEVLIANFLKKHESMIEKYKKEELDDSAYVKQDIFDISYEAYLSYKGELKAHLFTPKTVQNNDSASSNTNKDSVASLPKIRLPVFGGLYTEWVSFRDLFISLVHNNAALDDVQRLHYLKTQVKGEAEQLIKHVPITHANYKKCWELLHNTYNNKRYISNCVIKRLVKQRVLNSENSQGLKELLNTTADCIHELDGLGLPVETWDVMILFLVSEKLDAETRKQWELEVNRSCFEFPSFQQFREFMESRYRALETVELCSRGKSNPNLTNTTKVLHVTSNTHMSCPLCKEDHKLYSCKKFTKDDISKRRNIVKSLGLCFNCLRNNHTVNNCRISFRCRLCKAKHHTMLHGKTYAVALATKEPENEDTQSEPSCETRETTNLANHFATGEVHNQTLLATALIKAESKNGQQQILRALLDQGSQASFISEAAVQLLQLNKIASKCTISDLGGKQSGLTSKYEVMVNIQSLCDPTFSLQVKAHVLNAVTSILPEKKFVLPIWTELSGIKLADPHYNTPNKIDILLGSEVYCSVLKKGLIKNPIGSIIAQDTYLGWMLSGQIGGYHGKELACHNVVVNCHVEKNDSLRKLWELVAETNLNTKKILTPKEQECKAHFDAKTCRDTSGRYVVELPFRPNVNREYGDTRSVCVKRLLSLDRRIAKRPKQQVEYAKVLNEYLTLGHTEEVSTQSAYEKVWLPHHVVVRMDRTTTKTRVCVQCVR